MICPVDGTTLQMSERSGIEIDYCPQCRGVWLDRGELDKIIEKNAQASEAETPPQPAPPPSGQSDGRWSQSAAPSYGHQPRGHGHKHHKRRKSFLQELFD